MLHGACWTETWRRILMTYLRLREMPCLNCHQELLEWIVCFCHFNNWIVSYRSFYICCCFLLCSSLLCRFILSVAVFRSSRFMVWWNTLGSYFATYLLLYVDNSGFPHMHGKLEKWQKIVWYLRTCGLTIKVRKMFLTEGNMHQTLIFYVEMYRKATWEVGGKEVYYIMTF